MPRMLQYVCGTLSLLAVAGGVVQNAAIDISHYQSSPNFTEVVESGIEIVIHKASQGSSYVDRTYEERRAGALRAGLKYWGAYHFADGSDPEAQAKHFLATAAPAHFYALDFEDNPTGERTTVSLSVAEALVLAVTALTGQRPIVYGGAYFLNKWPKSHILSSCPLWVASWRNEPTIPHMWTDWVLWQHTDGSHGPEPHYVPGIGNCDRSRVNKTSFLKHITPKKTISQHLLLPLPTTICG